MGGEHFAGAGVDQRPGAGFDARRGLGRGRSGRPTTAAQRKAPPAARRQASADSSQLQRLAGDQDLRVDFGVEREDAGDRDPGPVGDRDQGVAALDYVGLGLRLADGSCAWGGCRDLVVSAESPSELAIATMTTIAAPARATAAKIRAKALVRFSMGRDRNRFGAGDRIAAAGALRRSKRPRRRPAGAPPQRLDRDRRRCRARRRPGRRRARLRRRRRAAPACRPGRRRRE